jgi:hypothetical protein
MDWAKSYCPVTYFFTYIQPWKKTGSAIALAWGDNYPQDKSLAGDPVNQDVRANDSIREKLISIPCLGKGSMVSGAVNGYTKVNESKMLKIRTSNRTKKAPATKKFFYGKADLEGSQ